MKKLTDFTYYVAITPQEQLSLVAFCSGCALTWVFMDSDKVPTAAASTLVQHECFQRIVSIPK